MSSVVQASARERWHDIKEANWYCSQGLLPALAARRIRAVASYAIGCWFESNRGYLDGVPEMEMARTRSQIPFHWKEEHRSRLRKGAASVVCRLDEDALAGRQR